MSELKSELVTISITRKLRDDLKESGKKGETYDTIIRRLLEASKNG